MQRPLIYLCGPIDGIRFVDAGSWRNKAAQLLAPEFGVLDPLHAHEYEGTDYSQYTDAQIKVRDLAYIGRSRAVLRGFFGQSSEGSAMETFHASHHLGLPVVTFGTDTPRESLPLWLRLHTIRNFWDLDEAVTFLKREWLFPGEAVEPKYDAREHVTSRSAPAALSAAFDPRHFRRHIDGGA